VVANCTQATEPWARRLGVGVERRQGHQSDQLEVWRGVRVVGHMPCPQLDSVVGQSTACEVDLDVYLEPPAGLSCGGIESRHQLGSVDRVDYIEQLGRLACLIALESTDQMPDRVALHLGYLGLGFLDPVLSEVTNAELDDRLNGLGRPGLAHREEPDVVGRAAAPNGRGRDPCLDALDPIFDVVHKGGW